MFESRERAAELLALRLMAYRGRNPLVLGIPRGAVVMARVIARELGGQVDVALVHKLRAPRQPELAIGAVDEAGNVALEPFAAEAGATERLVAAAGVAAAEAVDRLSALADEVAVLEIPHELDAVSLWFQHFPQVEDAEVVALLRAAEGEAGGRETPPKVGPGPAAEAL